MKEKYENFCKTRSVLLQIFTNNEFKNSNLKIRIRNIEQ